MFTDDAQLREEVEQYVLVQVLANEAIYPQVTPINICTL